MSENDQHARRTCRYCGEEMDNWEVKNRTTLFQISLFGYELSLSTVEWASHVDCHLEKELE